jgi:hypothetical protein
MVTVWRWMRRDDSGQALPIVLGLITFIFIVGTAVAVQASAALRAGAANARQAAELLAADAGGEFGIWSAVVSDATCRGGIAAGTSTTITVNSQPVTVYATGATGWTYTGNAWGQAGFDAGNLKKSTTSTGPASMSQSRTIPISNTGQNKVEYKGAPVVASNGYWYVARRDGLEARRPDGTMAWCFSSSKSKVKGVYSGTPALLEPSGGGSRVLFIGQDDRPGSGAEFDAIEEIVTGPSLIGSTIKWCYSLSKTPGTRAFWSSPKISNGRVYVASNLGYVYAFNTNASGDCRTGSDAPYVWRTAIPGSPRICAPPAINPNPSLHRLYVIGDDGALRALDLDNGNLIWTISDIPAPQGGTWNCPDPTGITQAAMPNAPVYVQDAARDIIIISSDKVRGYRDDGSIAAGTTIQASSVQACTTLTYPCKEWDALGAAGTWNGPAVSTVPAQQVSAYANTGANFNDGGAKDWTNPQNVQGPTPATAATVLLDNNGDTSQRLRCSNYGLSIPSGALIAGVRFTVSASSANNNRQYWNSVKLLKGGVETGVEKITSLPGNQTAINSLFPWPFGGQSDLWGTSLTAADVNSPDFGVSLKIVRSSNVQTTTTSIYTCQVTVWYTNVAMNIFAGNDSGQLWKWTYDTFDATPSATKLGDTVDPIVGDTVLDQNDALYFGTIGGRLYRLQSGGSISCSGNGASAGCTARVSNFKVGYGPVVASGTDGGTTYRYLFATLNSTPGCNGNKCLPRVLIVGPTPPGGSPDVVDVCAYLRSPAPQVGSCTSSTDPNGDVRLTYSNTLNTYSYWVTRR